MGEVWKKVLHEAKDEIQIFEEKVSWSRSNEYIRNIWGWISLEKQIWDA